MQAGELRRYGRAIVGIVSKIVEVALYVIISNVYTGFYRLMFHRRVVAFHLNTASQFGHIESILITLAREHRETLLPLLITDPSEIAPLSRVVRSLDVSSRIFPTRVTRYLIFVDVFISVDQGAHFPLSQDTKKVCMFHGQPSKGNVYQRFNFHQINYLLLYGPLMKEYYLEQKAMNPHWPPIHTFDIGQPSSDLMFNGRLDKLSARSSLGLPNRPTVVYAPSFEACSSLATHGRAILSSILERDFNVIFRPHPGFFRQKSFTDSFNAFAPCFDRWADALSAFSEQEAFLLLQPESDRQLLSSWAADVFITDYSGVAFDAISLDIGVIFWDCPNFFYDYLPERYGIDPIHALNSLSCNAGRAAGLVVRDLIELHQAIDRYLCCPNFKGEERADIAARLLFNKGSATVAMTQMILELLERKNDGQI
jgi:hypothetical protein